MDEKFSGDLDFLLQDMTKDVIDVWREYTVWLMQNER